MENCPKDSLKTYVRDRAGPVAVGPRETGDGRVIDRGDGGAALPEGDREIRAEESPGPPARHLWDKARREGMGDWGKGDPSRAGNGRMAARRAVPVSAGAASRASAAEKISLSLPQISGRRVLSYSGSTYCRPCLYQTLWVKPKARA